MSQVSNMNNWYTNAYSGSFRTNRIRAPPFLPGSRLNAHQQTVTALQQTLVVDAARATGGTSEGKEDGKNARRRETIFGPDVGEDDEPGWTKPEEGATVGVDVVKGWVEKAKKEDGLHATTTLQALVNLKRPTLLLQQQFGADLQDGDVTPGTDSQVSLVHHVPRHLLKFNYDATAPLVRISLSVHPLPTYDPEGKASIAEADIKIVYSGVHLGGFNQLFTLPAHAALDLTDAIAPLVAPVPDGLNRSIETNDAQSAANVTTPAVVWGSQSEDTNHSSLDRSMDNMQLSGATEPDLATVPEGGIPNGSSTPAQSQGSARTPRRFGIFPRRQREPDVEFGQIEMSDRPADVEGEKQGEVKGPERGMRLLIKIEALGDEGQDLKRRNAQLTHILTTGIWSPDAGSTNPVGQYGKRVWVIKVVRREAVIGAHTFLLKEIYGLSSSTQTQQPTSYPPTAGAEPDPYASTPNECIVCLTAPRDVVLLPCRHLVVCRDCAVGMVEFGAGGKVGRREDTAGGGGTTEDPMTGADGTPPANGATNPQVAGGTTTTGRERRKKKAKGWYCPVCRQPYTSLLRLALPTSSKPQPDDTISHRPSRAPSIRSVRSSHTLHRAPSIEPTLPAGAERMLNELRPDQDDEEDNDADQEPVGARSKEPERPQFILGAEVDEEDDKKGWTENQAISNSQNQTIKEGSSKGWKEVA